MFINLHKAFAQAATFLLLGIAASVQGQAVLSTLDSFTFTNGPVYGAFGVGNRSGAMVQATDGNFYGTTPTGGVVTNVPGYFGTIFKMKPTGEFTSLYLFGTSYYGPEGNDNGHWPQGNLIQGTDGLLYGTTQYGGPLNGGTVFRISTNGDFATFYLFGNNAGNDAHLGWTNYDGNAPIAGLVQGSDGNFYGTTTVYGMYGNGTIFQISSGGVLTTLHAFTALDTANSYTNADGANPMGELIEGADGSLYGTTTQGGTNVYGAGTVFKITTDGQFTTLHSFGANDGYPDSGLVQDDAGNLYGTTTGGSGTLFKITTNGAFSTLHAFNGSDGVSPNAALTKGADGNLYGTANSGGPDGSFGTVFQVTTNGTFTLWHAFNGTDGSNPSAALVQSSNGSLYGTTSRGASGSGTIFQLVPQPAIQSIWPTNGSFLISWSGMPNQHCQLQYNNSLSATTWSNLGPSVTVTNGNLSALDSPVMAPQRFYRVKVLP